MIHFRQVTKKFPPDSVALEDITFSIDPGELVYISGPSGAGKTTLGKLMIKELDPTTGEIEVGEYSLGELVSKELPDLRKQIGFVFQDYKLLPDRTAAENIALMLEIMDKSMDETYAKVKELLELTGLEGKGNLFPNQLSGGEVQRTVIARALASEPAVLFADEPTGNLDDQTAMQITKLLKEINNVGTTVIIATHDKNLINAFKGRHIKLDGGKIVEDTGVKKLSKKRAALGGGKPKGEGSVSKKGKSTEEKKGKK